MSKSFLTPMSFTLAKIISEKVLPTMYKKNRKESSLIINHENQNGIFFPTIDIYIDSVNIHLEAKAFDSFACSKHEFDDIQAHYKGNYEVSCEAFDCCDGCRLSPHCEFNEDDDFTYEVKATTERIRIDTVDCIHRILKGLIRDIESISRCKECHEPTTEEYQITEDGYCLSCHLNNIRKNSPDEDEEDEKDNKKHEEEEERKEEEVSEIDEDEDEEERKERE